MGKPALPKWDNSVELLRPFSRIRLVVADLDGTFVRPGDFRLSRKVNELSNTLRHYRYQVNLTLATGRTLAGVLPLLSQLTIRRGMPIILYNGSVVVENKTSDVRFQRVISAETLATVLAISWRLNARTLVYVYEDPRATGHGLLRHPGPNEYVLGWSRNERPVREFNGMEVVWQSWESLREGLTASALLLDVPNDPEAMAFIEMELMNIAHITLTRSGSGYIEMRPSGTNKGIALARVASLLHLSQDEILALGDNDNDAEMLSWAGIGVAVAGASKTAVLRSDYVCQYDAAQGAVEVLRLVNHARRYFFEPGNP